MSSHFKLKPSVLAAATACFICPSLAIANEQAPIVADTVVVTASRTQQNLLDVNSSMSVVSADDIAISARDNVPDLLRRTSGVQLTSDGTPGVKRIGIRGENASRTLVMVDGQRIDDQKTKSGVPVLVNPFFTERVEVVKGPASVLYGSDAMGGIVNVITKQASKEAFSADLGTSYNGSNNAFSEYANISGTLDRFKYVLGGFNTNTGDLYLSDRQSLDNTSYDAAGINGDFSFDITDKFTIGYAGDFYHLSSETATTVDHPVYGDYRAEMPKWDRQKHKLYFKAADINDWIAAIDGSFYYQKNDKEFNSWPQKGLIVEVDNQQATYGGNLQLELSLGDMFYLVTGYDGRFESLDSTSDINLRMGPIAGDIHLDDDTYKQDNHALYAMLSTYLTDELTLNTGVRYNYIKTKAGSTLMSGRMNIMGQAIPLNTELNLDDRVEVKTVGSAGLVYRPFDHGAFRLNWSQGFRAPTIQELFLITSTGTLQMGNPDLIPEESDNFELGFRWEDPKGLTADVALFYSKADNYIETVQAGQFYSYRNIAKATTSGAEVSASYLINGKYEPYATLTALHRKYETSSGSSSNTGTPRFSGNAGMRYYGSYFDADAYAQFATETKNDNLDGTSYFGDIQYGGYVTYNLSISSSFGPNDQFTVYGSLENIFDKHYQTSELIHEPGRFVTVGIRGKF